MNDLFHKDQNQPLGQEQQDSIKAIKEKAEELYSMIQALQEIAGQGAKERCYAIAKTKLEAAVMWAVKGITTK